MSISPTTKKCPTCENQMLDAISASAGNWYACPSCGGILIHQDVLTSLSANRQHTQKTLVEAKSLLIPTERLCPHCSKKLFDGRSLSTGLIFTLCGACLHIWTGLEVLAQLDESVEYTLRSSMEAPWAETLHPSPTPPPITHVDEGPGHLFRGVARLFDSVADKFAKKVDTPPPATPPPGRFKLQPQAPLPWESSLPDNPDEWPPELLEEFKKMSPQDFPVMNEAPPALPPVFTPPPAPASVPKSEPKAEPKPAPIPEKKPEPVVEPVQPPGPVWDFTPIVAPHIEEELFEFPPAMTLPVEEQAPVIPTPETKKPEKKPEPIPEPIVIPQPAPQPPPFREPVPSPTPAIAASAPPPVQAPISIPTPLVAPKPVEKKEFKAFTYVAKTPSLLDKVKAALAPKPKAKPTPAPAPAAIPAPKPVVIKAPEMPAPIPKPVELKPPVVKPAEEKPKKPGVLAAMKAAWSPRPQKKPDAAKPIVEPVKAPVELPMPKVEVAAPAPAPTPKAEPAPKPAPVPKPVVVKPPKPQKEKGPKEPFDALLFALPWGLCGLLVFLSSFREYGFENEPAVLWGIMGWALGMIARTVLMYPFQPFQSDILSALKMRTDLKGWRGIPVELSGEVVLEKEDLPKGPVVLQQDGERIALSRVSLWDMVPRLVGLANPGQLIRGAVTITGWYRRGAVPFIEVHEIRAEKSSRKSLVKAMRLAGPILVFVIALLINLSLE